MLKMVRMLFRPTKSAWSDLFRPARRDVKPLSQRAPTGVLCRTQYRLAQLEQVHERAGQVEPFTVLAQPAIAHFGEAKHPLEDQERMLDARPGFGSATAATSLMMVPQKY